MSEPIPMRMTTAEAVISPWLESSQCDQPHRREKQEHQQAGVAPGTGLALEKTGMSHVSEPQKATFGTLRASGVSSSS